MWPALCMEGVQLVISDIFNNAQGKKDVDNIQELIKQYPNTQKHLFGVNSSAAPKPIDINKMLFLLIAAEIIDVHYEHDPEKKTADVTLSLAKVQSMRPIKRLVDEGFWMCIMMKDPILNYDE